MKAWGAFGELLRTGVPVNAAASILVTERNADGYINEARGTLVPATAAIGYAFGCKFIKTDATLGQCIQWVNIGSITSALFVPVGPVTGYGFAYAGGPVDCTTGSTTLVVANGRAKETDLALVGCYASDDSDAVSIIATAAKNYLTILESADPLTAHDYVFAGLRSSCVPEFDIVAAGSRTTVGGGTAEAITVTGAAVGDIAFVTYGGTNDTDVIMQSVVTANTLTVTMSADPGTAHILNYVIIRLRGGFKPSHYVAFAGTKTCVTGSATQSKTVTGLLATDIVISCYNTSDDADTILKVVPTADTITWTLSADPLAAHALTYVVLRPYS
jgi:hypothetical protein